MTVEEDIYDDVDEDKYQELVSKRREDNFIEDDGVAHQPAATAKLPLHHAQQHAAAAAITALRGDASALGAQSSRATGC